MHKLSNSVPAWLRILIPAAIIIVWLVLGAVGGPFFGRIGEVSTNNLTDFLPKTSESAQVQDKLSDFTDADTIPAIVILSRDGNLTDSDREYLGETQQALAGLPGVKGGASPPIFAEDGTAAQIIVPIDTSDEINDVVGEVRALVDGTAPENLTHYVAGPAGFAADLSTAFSGIDGILLLVALSVVFVILLLVYKSPMLPFIVLGTSIFALSASILLVWNLANADIVRLNGQVQGILFILVIGAATDYSLLYVSRYREELIRHKEKLTATIAALRGSLEPILASGGTVIVGLMFLLLSELDSNKALGPVGGIGIVMSMTAALTFLPAMLYVFGRKVYWPFQPVFDEAVANREVHTGSKLWTGVARFVDRHARRVWVVSLLVLLIAAAGMFQLKASGVPQGDIIIGASESRDGQDEIAEHFPAGSGSPAIIVGPANKLDEIVSAAQIDMVDSIVAISKQSPTGSVPVGDAVANTPPALAMIPPTVVDGEVMLRATLADESDSAAAEETIAILRERLQRVDDTVLVGGSTATTVDTTAASLRDRAVIIPVILLAILLILILLLRSLVAPVLLIATTALSFAASLGVAAFVFNDLLGMPGSEASIPLYAFVFLVALGIDYNIFLTTRVCEETIHHGTREGTLRGLAVTGGVITSAGVVLAATFAALSVIPILFLLQMAFIVAFGVLLDTFLVRSLFVPALIVDIDKRAWWPSKLSK